MAAARSELDTIKELQQSLPTTTLPYWREEVQVHIDAVSSWIAFREGDNDDALMLARAAADREDAVDKHPVTPGEVLPARELLADMLAESGKLVEALKEYENVLKSSPGRLNSMIGAADAAEKLGKEALAEELESRIRQQTDNRDGQRPNLSSLLGS